MNQDLSNFLKYLSFKMDTLREQEENPLTLNVSLCQDHLDVLGTLKTEKVEALRKAMPQKVNTKTREIPKVLFKADGCLSKLGESWFDQLRELKLPKDTQVLNYVDSYEDGNPDSPVQIKEWLYGLGWKPRTFKYQRNKKTGEEKKIPQVRKDGLLCESVRELVKKDPAIELYDGLSVISHRIGVLNGFMNAQKDGKVIASASGFTNTLRLKHRAPVVNLPGVEATYGKWCRDVLVPEDGYVFVGADVTSLEDTLKQHYIYPHDPEFVEEMNTEGFDPHLTLAVLAGAITEDDYQFYINYKGGDDSRYKIIKSVRHPFKVVNYSAQYQVGKKTLARNSGMSEKEAQKLLDTYWEKNKAIVTVSKEQYVKTLPDGSMYLKNPINGFYYSLRNERDTFSTLVQGSGDYVFNVWLMFCRKMGIKVHMNYHDEWLASVPQDKAKGVFDISEKAMDKLNEALKLNKVVAADAQAGYSYAECH